MRGRRCVQASIEPVFLFSTVKGRKEKIKKEFHAQNSKEENSSEAQQAGMLSPTDYCTQILYLGAFTGAYLTSN